MWGWILIDTPPWPERNQLQAIGIFLTTENLPARPNGTKGRQYLAKDEPLLLLTRGGGLAKSKALKGY